MDLLVRITSQSSQLPSGTFNGTYRVAGHELAWGSLRFTIDETTTLQAEFLQGEVTNWAVSRQSPQHATHPLVLARQ